MPHTPLEHWSFTDEAWLRAHPNALPGSWRAMTPEETIRLGVRIGAALEPGDVLGLIGPLGAGKTQLVHGLVRGFAARDHLGLSTHLNDLADSPRDLPRVCSPSYTIINTYHLGELCVHHADLYRLRSYDDLESTGYWDAVDDPAGVVIVEWIDHVAGASPPHAATLCISPEDPEQPLYCPRLLRLAAPPGDLRARLLAALSSPTS
jgi:tRNA threonylcarbamoyladenosine biosynthesis protein TsaE